MNTDIPSIKLTTNVYVIDVETSGLDPILHGILSIAAVCATTGAEFHMDCQLRRGAAVCPEALEVNGFTVESLRDPSKPLELDALDALFKFTGPGKLVMAGMNVGKFDWMFIDDAARRHGRRNLFGHRTLDLHTLAYAHAIQLGLMPPAGGYRTDEIYELLGLPPEPKPHNALTGARREFEAFQSLFGHLCQGGVAV